MENTVNFFSGFVSNCPVVNVDLQILSSDLSGNDVCSVVNVLFCKQMGSVLDACVENCVLDVSFQVRSNIDKASPDRLYEIAKVLSFCSLTSKTRKEILSLFKPLCASDFENESEYEIACKLRDLNCIQILVDLGYLVAFDIPLFENNFGAKRPMRNRQSFVLSVSGGHLLSFLVSKGVLA